MIDIFIDTNILVYALDKQSVFYYKASGLLTNENNNLFITTKNISEYFCVCTKMNLNRDTIFNFYKDFRKNCTLLFPNDISIKKFETLITKYNPKGNRIFDFEIISVMLASNIRKIATFNKTDFINISEIELINI